jgi:hypothetical protein
MWAAINSSTNVFRVIVGTARGRVHRSPAASPVMLRTKQQAPRVRPSTGHPQGPASGQRIGHRFADLFVWVIRHAAGIILRSLSSHRPCRAPIRRTPGMLPEAYGVERAETWEGEALRRGWLRPGGP